MTTPHTPEHPDSEGSESAPTPPAPTPPASEAPPRPAEPQQAPQPGSPQQGYVQQGGQYPAGVDYPQPPYPQAPYQQRPYPQAQYPQPPYPQPPYQQPYAQLPYAQPPYAQPQYPQYAQTPYLQPAPGQPATYPGQYAQPSYAPGPAYAPQPQYPLAGRAPRRKLDENGVPYGAGPFTVREVIFLGASALVLIASFLPFLGEEYSEVFGYASVWAPAPWLAIPAVLVLVAAAGLVAVRRLAPARPRRVGSLSVDQFASVAAVVTAGFYLGALFLIMGFTAWFGGGADPLTPGVGVVLGLLASLSAVAVTTLAPLLPPFAEEFSTRRETPAHPVAREAGPVALRPRAERPSPDRKPAQTGASGLPVQRPAGPGEFAAYQRRGSQAAARRPDSFPAAAEPVASAVPQAAADDPSREQDVRPAPAVDSRKYAAEHEDDAQPPVTGEPLQDADADRQTFPPGFVATEVPAVDPVAVPAGSEDDEDADEESADSGPVSAIRHVSASGGVTPADPRSSQAAGRGDQPAAPREQHARSAPEQPTAVYSTQPFWVYSPVPRAVVDEVSGATVFEIGPSAWALAITDRGSELVIRHDDGRIGVLRDLDGITRG